jgi:hypothetical protein
MRAGRSSLPRPKNREKTVRRRLIWGSRSSVIRTISQSIAADAAAYEGRRLREGLLTRPTRRAAFGPTSTDRRTTRRLWRRTALSAMSIARSRRGARCRKQYGGRMPSRRKSARASSMCSPNKTIGCVCLSAPSASPGRQQRSDWQTSSTTSSACSSCAALPRLDRQLRSQAAPNPAPGDNGRKKPGQNTDQNCATA